MKSPALRFRSRFLFLAALLPIFDSASAQTVEWWDPAAVAESEFPPGYNFPGISDVEASPWGIYSVGMTQCVDNPAHFDRPDCKGLLVKYDTQGNVLWQKLVQDRDDTWIKAVVADESGVYVHGTYQWNTQFPTDESFLQKYAHDGTLLWHFRDSEGNPKGYRINRIRAKALLLYDGYLYAASQRNRGPILRKFSLDGELVWLVDGVFPGSLTAGDGLIFASVGTPQVLDTDGNLVNTFFAATIGENGLAYHDGALYFCSRDPYGSSRDKYQFNKMLPDGTLIWTIEFGRTKYFSEEGCGVHVDANGVTFAVNLRTANDATYPANLSIRRFSFDGEELSRWDFPSLAAIPNAVSVLGDEVYIGGYDLETGKGITGRLSGAPLLKPALARLDGSIPGSAERLAVLDHHYGAGPVTARVQVPGSDTGHTVHFSDGLRPVDFFAAEDMDGNGRDELVVLSKVPPVVEIVDNESGDQLLHLELDADFEPVAAVIAYDDTTPVLAVLNKHLSRNYLRVETFDATTGTSLGTIAFNPAFTPLDLYALPSASGLRYAVLAVDTTGVSPDKLEIRNADGSLDRNLWLGTEWTPLRGLQYEESGAARIALLRRHAEEGWLRLDVVDPDGGVLSTLPFNPQFVPDDFEHSPDVDANLAPQFTVAGRNDIGKVKAETRDLASGALLHNVFLAAVEPIEDLIYLAPGPGVSTPSLALLVRDDIEMPSRYRVVLVDLLTGSKVVDWYFDFGTL